MQTKQEWFKDARDYDVGRVVIGIPIPRHTRIDSLNNGKSRYFYQFEKIGCRWSFLINDKSLIVESWKYESDKRKCYIEIDWLGPW